jgi:hypothetical protein
VRASPRRWLALAAVALVALVGAFAPGRADDKSDKKTPAVSPMPPQGPEQPADTTRLLPGGIWLSAEKYQELLDDQARLRGKEPPADEAPKVVEPTRLLLTKGRVDGNLVYFKVQIDFVATERRSVLPLAFTQGQLTDILLDGRTPGLRRGPEGLAVVINHTTREQQVHKLVFDVVARLVDSPQRGGCLVLKLDLPRAPITHLDLTLPEGFKDLRLNDRPVGERPGERIPGEPGEGPGQHLLELHGRRLTGPLFLGTERLQLSWRGARAATGPLQTSADGRVLVAIDERHMVHTEATLTLKVLSNQTDQWRLLVPPGAQVKMATVADEGRLKEANVLALPFFSIWTLTLKERSAEPLGVIVTQESTVLRPGNAPTLVGPFLVVGAARQSGTLLVTNTAGDLGLRCLPFAATTSRALTADELRQPGAQGFHYYGPSLSTPNDDPRTLALLALQAEAKHGAVTVRPVYQLRLSRATGERRWQLLTTLDVRLVEPGVQRLEILLPADCRYVPMTPEEDRPPPPPVLRVEAPASSPPTSLMLGVGGSAALARPSLVLHLSRDRWEDFKFSFRVQYIRPATPDTAIFVLPRSRGASDGLPSLSATVTVPDDVELLVPGGANGDWELARQTPQEFTWKHDSSASPPDRLTVAWREYRPEVRARSDINLDLLPRVGKVTQELKMQFPRGTQPLLALRLPPGLVGLRVLKGGSVQTLSAPPPLGEGLCYIKPDEGASKGPDWELTLTYEFPLPDRPSSGLPAALLKVPLPRPVAATVSETRVRVWGEPGALPFLAPGSTWSEQALEPEPADPRRPARHPGRLPVLVLRSDALDGPLTLRMGEPGPGPSAAVLTDRALIRVTLEGKGEQQVRARFRLVKLFAHHLDLELPAPVAGRDLRVALDGIMIDPETVDEEGRRSDTGRFARLRLNPDLVKRGSVLDVRYQLRAPQGTYQTVLQPPILHGGPGQLVICWQVVLPGGTVAIGPEGGPTASRTWGRRGWLLAPLPADRADDLERWIAGPDATPAPGTEVGTLVCWRDGFEPLTVTCAPQQTWLLACSLSLLVAALGIVLLLGRALRGRQPGERNLGGRFAWLALVLLTSAGVGAALIWPTTTAALAFGAEPGAAVLVLVLLVAFLWHEQRRRRIAYLPSFRRGQQNSSLVRPPSTPPVRPQGEPSTVDVPRPASSQYPAASEAARSEISRK